MKILGAAFLVLGLRAASGTPLQLSVCCSTGSSACSTSSLVPSLRSLSEARAFLAKRRSAGAPPQSAIINVYGTCYEQLLLSKADGGEDDATRITFRGVPGTRAGISAALPIFANNLSPVSDPGVLAQLQLPARAMVRQLNLSAMGVPLAAPACQPYVGGNSVMTPGLLQPAGAELFSYGDPSVGGDAGPLTPARFPNAVKGGPTVAWSSVFNLTTGPSGVGARIDVLDAAAAARAPLWAQQAKEDPGSLRVKFILELGWAEHTQALVSVGSEPPVPPPVPPPTCADTITGFGVSGNDLAGTPLPGLASAGDCCAACSGRTNCRFWTYVNSNCYMQYANTTGSWQPSAPGAISGVTTAAYTAVAAVLGQPCNTSASEDAYDDGGIALLSNVLAELDTPGEYTINRTSGMAYVWWPASGSDWPSVSPWGSPLVDSGNRSQRPSLRGLGAPIGYVSAAPHAVALDGASFLTFSGLVIEGAQDAAFVARNCTNVVVEDSTIQNSGNMAVNITRGSGVSLVRSVVRGGANGAALLEGGDRPTLTPGGHSIFNSTLSYSSRLVWDNAPMVSLDGVGHVLAGSEIFGGPHMGLYFSGNNHSVLDNKVHDVVQACDDAGAVYTGRDWAYQGSLVKGNTLWNLHTSEGLDVSAVYLDDMVSGVTVTDNTIMNVSRALLLGGGRWNVFARNIIRGISQANDAAVHFDNRGQGWANPSCNFTAAAPAIPNMVALLERVPYNSSAVWLTAFPWLADILEDDPCAPKYNAIVNNTYCGLETGIPFLDQSDETIAGWGSTANGNVNASSCNMNSPPASGNEA